MRSGQSDTRPPIATHAPTVPKRATQSSTFPCRSEKPQTIRELNDKENRQLSKLGPIHIAPPRRGHNRGAPKSFAAPRSKSRDG
jgi:hypothetical protein